jgi:hypothetical protein
LPSNGKSAPFFFWREILDFFAVAVDDQRTGCPGGALLELCHNGASIIID